MHRGASTIRDRPMSSSSLATGREAERLAEQAEQANQRRKLLQDRVVRDIESELDAHPSRLDRRVLVFSGSDWQPGIVGLAASKLAERHDRPVIVLTVSDGVAHGSARSVRGFDITSALSAAKSLADPARRA